jgi:hypothetical protein
MNPEQLALDFFEFLASIGPKLFELFKAGGRDAVLTALDASLVAIREKTDADLRAKHRGET